MWLHRLKKMLLEQRDYESILLDRFEKEIPTFPEGSLSLKKVKGNAYIYLHNKTLSETRLLSPKKKEDADIIEKIRKKYFVKKSISQLRKNKKIMDSLLRNLIPFDPGEIRNHMSSVYKEVQIIEWKSKMELALEKWKVKNEDENSLNIRGQKFFPDFTIFRSFDNRIIYWEHFGMINDTEYKKNMEMKLLAYGNSEIIPWDNLVLTFDSNEGCIDVSMISSIIDKMLLI